MKPQNAAQSATPRTDAKCSDYAGPLSFVGDEQFLPADFARTLERELVASRAEIAHMRMCLTPPDSFDCPSRWRMVAQKRKAEIDRISSERDRLVLTEKRLRKHIEIIEKRNSELEDLAKSAR